MGARLKLVLTPAGCLLRKASFCMLQTHRHSKRVPGCWQRSSPFRPHQQAAALYRCSCDPSCLPDQARRPASRSSSWWTAPGTTAPTWPVTGVTLTPPWTTLQRQGGRCMRPTTPTGAPTAFAETATAARPHLCSSRCPQSGTPVACISLLVPCSLGSGSHGSGQGCRMGCSLGTHSSCSVAFCCHALVSASCLHADGPGSAASASVQVRSWAISRVRGCSLRCGSTHDVP